MQAIALGRTPQGHGECPRSLAGATFSARIQENFSRGGGPVIDSGVPIELNSNVVLRNASQRAYPYRPYQFSAI
jgi:hypothetical protein